MTIDAVPGVADPAGASAVPEAPAPNVVDVGACRCPTKPHEADLVVLHPEITLPLGIAAMAVLRQGGGVAAVYGGLADVYLQLGIAAWTFTDEKGQPVPITAANIVRLLPFAKGGLKVADAADDLYAKDLLHPLALERPELLPSGPSGTSTSVSPPSGVTSRTPSERSSRNGTHGKASVGPAR